MSTRAKFIQLLMKLRPNLWRYDANIYSIEKGDVSIRMYPNNDMYYAGVFKGEKELCRISAGYRSNPDLHNHLQDCVDAAIERDAIKAEEVMDEFASIIFGVGDKKAAPSTSFDIERCAPAEV